jgi:hypothetical protein
VLQNNASVRVIRDADQRDLGEFRTRSGGGREGDNQLIRPGGMAPPVAMVGTYEYGEVTAARVVNLNTDSGLVQEVDGWYGDRVTLVEQPLDGKGRTGFHRPVSWSGLLNGHTLSDYDADSNDAKTLELAITVDRLI